MYNNITIFTAKILWWRISSHREYHDHDPLRKNKFQVTPHTIYFKKL